MSAGRHDILLALGFAVLLAMVPLVFGTRYIVSQITLFFIWGIVVTQWNLVLGVAGIFSLAQMALFAIGAYATAMLAYYGAFPLLAAMPLAALVTVAASLLIGFACLRLKGAYVALLTLAVAQVIYLIVVNDTACFTNPPSGCLPLFGGVRGFSRFGDLGFRDLLGSKFYIGHYYVGLGLLLAAQIFCIILIRGPLGLAFRALRDNPGYAMSRGVGRLRYQLWVFGLSAFFTGLAGAFYAANFGVVGPIVFSVSMLLFLLAMIVLGGIGTVWGPLLGAALLMAADEGLREFGTLREIGLGLVLAIFVILLPRGLSGLRRR
ncbi:MAG: branched-chain amino acid ABC transporter permease [Tabrizicola sp.]|jgi:branched-chain amino acid transport system permease protein|nr:branched-chain amino acid ABC transporter permease [Tabrizicola sp.]